MRPHKVRAAALHRRSSFCHRDMIYLVIKVGRWTQERGTLGSLLIHLQGSRRLASR